MSWDSNSGHPKSNFAIYWYTLYEAIGANKCVSCLHRQAVCCVEDAIFNQSNIMSDVYISVCKYTITMSVMNKHDI